MSEPELDCRQLIERASDIIYAVDRHGRFRYLNAAGLRRLGYNENERADAWQVAFREHLTPESARTVVEHHVHRLHGEPACPILEIDVVRRDGSGFEAEVWVDDIVRDGRVAGWQGIARDMSAVRILQAEVAEKSRRLALLEDRARLADDLYRRVARLAMPEGISSVDGLARGGASALVRQTVATQLGLSSLDVEVLELVASGLSNAQVATEVHLSTYTVKDHVAKIASALGACGRVRMVVEAFRRGILEPPSIPPSGGANTPF